MDFVSAKTKDDPKKTAKFFLHRHYTKPRPNRSKLAIHASDLYGDWESFCPRERALRWLYQTENEAERLSTAIRMTFELGKMVHNLVVQGLAREGVAIMDWTCRKCGAEYPRRAMPSFCSACQANRREMIPHELKFQSPISGVTGSIDCFFDNGSGKVVPVEIKSIDKEEFKGLVMPKAEHRWRTQLYLRLIAECSTQDPWIEDHVDFERGIVIYVSKGGYGVQDSKVYAYGWKERFSPFKEYKVERNDAHSDEAIAKALEYKSYRDKHGQSSGHDDASEHLPKRICGTPVIKRAKKCAMCKACFEKGMPE